MPFDQIFYWNSGVDFAPASTTIVGNLTTNSQGRMSTPNYETSTYTDIPLGTPNGYAVDANGPDGLDHVKTAARWSAIQNKFNGFHEDSTNTLTASLGNQAFNGIKIVLRFARTPGIHSSDYHHLEPNLAHVTIKQNGTVLRPSASHNAAYAGRGSPDDDYTWGFAKTVPTAGAYPGGTLNSSDVPNASWNTTGARPFTFAAGTGNVTTGNNRQDGTQFESITATSLAPFPPHTEGIDTPLYPGAHRYSLFEDHSTATPVAQLSRTNQYPSNTLNTEFNYQGELHSSARYWLSLEDQLSGPEDGHILIWDSSLVVPPNATFQVTFARSNIVGQNVFADGGVSWRFFNTIYDCRLELTSK